MLFALFFVAACGENNSGEDSSNHGVAQKTFILEVPKISHNSSLQTDLDIELTGHVNELSTNKYVDKVIKLYYGQWKDQLSYNDLAVQKVRVTKKNYKGLYTLVKTAADALEVKMPDVFIAYADQPSAYITNVIQPVLVIHSSLLELLNQKELLYVIGHELGHIRFKHMLSMEIVSTTYLALNLIPTDFLRNAIGNIAALSFLKWSREAEISADRAGLVLVGSKEVAAKTLIKLMSGMSDDLMKIHGEVDIKEFRIQSKKIEQAFILKKINVLLTQVTSTHPFIGSRIEALYNFSDSAKYVALLSNTKKIPIELVIRK